MSDADRDRLLNLAARRGVRQPVLVRDLLRWRSTSPRPTWLVRGLLNRRF